MPRLTKLSNDSIKLFRKERALFKATDKELTELEHMDLITLRRIFLAWNVPIKVDNIKVINTILIHVPLLIEALKKEIDRLKEEGFLTDNYKKTELRRINTLIEYIYDRYMPDEKRKVLKQQKESYKRNFPIQKGDILQLKDNRLVILDNISLDQKNHTNFTYRKLKVNLEESLRTRKIGIENISYYLKSSDFKAYQEHTPKKHLSLLKKWMEKRKSELATPEFSPYLFCNY